MHAVQAAQALTQNYTVEEATSDMADRQGALTS